MMLDPWQIKMFGGFALCRQDRTITRFPTQKTAALLAYLAYYPHQTHTREKLAELLWPETEPMTGRHRLRQTLVYLRRYLEPPGIPAGTVLRVHRLHIQINTETLQSDVAEFEETLRLAGVCRDNQERTHTLQRAVALYTGELLAGSYEEWCLPERERLAQRYRDALHQLIDLLEQQGDLSAAQDLAQRAVAADALDEAAHGALIRLAIAAGQPQSALRYYRELQRILQTELGVTPSQAIRQLLATLPADPTDRKPRPSEDPSPTTGEPSRIATSSLVVPTEAAVTLPVRLPLALTRFFGRDEEISLLLERIQSEATAREGSVASCPLITLTGPGGSGKTRLAIEVARQVAQQGERAVWFVSLADLHDPDRLPDVLRDALQTPLAPTQPVLEVLTAALNQQPTLLLLDNFEQLLDTQEKIPVPQAALFVRRLLEEVPSLLCLVTSRHRLGLEGEQEFPVPPLPLPDRLGTPEHLMAFAGIELFTERAQKARPDFGLTARNSADILAICQRLEGLPLALELAAARTSVLTPSQLLLQIERRFEFLVSRRPDIPSRHRSLRAAIDWSYELLPPELQRFFIRMSVFRGGWSLEMAEKVGDTLHALDYLEHLRDHSLISAVETVGEMRFQMLEMLRQYAQERGEERGEIAPAQDRHFEFLRHLTLEAEPHLRHAGQALWLARLDQEHDNLRAGLNWSQTQERHAEAGLQMASALFWFWMIRGHLREGREYLFKALAQPVPADATEQAKALNAAGALAYCQTDYPIAQNCFERGLALARKIPHPQHMAVALGNLGNIAYQQGHATESEAFFAEALTLYRVLKQNLGIASALNNLGSLAAGRRDFVLAETYYTESLAIRQQIQDRQGVATSLNNIGQMANWQGELERARSLFAQSLVIREEMGDKAGIASSCHRLGIVLQEQERLTESRSYLETSLRLAQELEDRSLMAYALAGFASLAVTQGHLERAVCLWGTVERLREQAQIALMPEERAGLEQQVAQLSDVVAPTVFARLWAEGRALSLQQAVVYAQEGDF